MYNIIQSQRPVIDHWSAFSHRSIVFTVAGYRVTGPERHKPKDNNFDGYVSTLCVSHHGHTDRGLIKYTFLQPG